MDRHGAYRILSETLADWRSRAFDAVHACLGEATETRVMRGQEEYIVHVTVHPVRREPDALRVEVCVDSPSTWRLDRLEDAAVIRRAGIA